MALNDNIRNTVNEFLNELKDVDINSQSFKEWFGNSKVVDSAGNPLMVYHGSRNTKIKSFKPNVDGIWFSDNLDVSKQYSSVTGLKQKRYSKKFKDIVNFAERYNNLAELLNDLRAIGYSVEKVKENEYGYINYYYIITDPQGESYKLTEHERLIDIKHTLIKTGKNYAAYLRIENPFIIDAKNSNWDNIKINNKAYTTMDISLHAKNNNHDGVIFKNLYEAGIKSNVYVVYHKDQIKIVN